MTIRTVLADDHPIVLDGLKALFSTEPDFEVVASARTSDEALRAVRELRPDILVLDLRMPGKHGLAVIKDITGERLPTHVVVLTALDNEEAVEAVHLGARGMVLKEMAPSLLLRCIREVHAGRRWLEKGIATQAVESLLKRQEGVRAGEGTLTQRELEVARLAAEGLSSKAVAKRLAISEGTAKLHLHHAYEKLKVNGRVGLYRYIHSHGLE
jgi:DNA-binding NarL/FixJ family response regulator